MSQMKWNSPPEMQIDANKTYTVAVDTNKGLIELELYSQHAPKTVNTDGWEATQSAWQRLFPQITVILCFLHSFLKIRDRCKRMKEHFSEICKRVWDTYHADHKQTFMAQIQDLETWTLKHLQKGTGRDAVLKLCNKAAQFAKAYDHPSAYRTSNMLDRHMDRMDRCFYSAQYFHGHLMTAEYKVRAWALFHHFQPYCPRTSCFQVQIPSTQAQRLCLS